MGRGRLSELNRSDKKTLQVKERMRLFMAIACAALGSFAVASGPCWADDHDQQQAAAALPATGAAVRPTRASKGQFSTIRPGIYTWSVPVLEGRGMKGTITVT